MYIHTTSNTLKSLSNNNILPEGTVVEFSDNNVAQVTKEVGETLINEFESIEEYNNE